MVKKANDHRLAQASKKLNKDSWTTKTGLLVFAALILLFILYCKYPTSKPNIPRHKRAELSENELQPKAPAKQPPSKDLVVELMPDDLNTF